VIAVEPGKTLNVRIRADELSIGATVSK